MNRELSTPRFMHTKYVVKCACIIARRNKVNKRSLLIAAWSHDWAREWPAEHLLRFTNMYKRPDVTEQKMPILLHAFVGAKLLKNNYPTLTNEIADAVAAHTVGVADMHTTGIALFCADYLASDRDIITKRARKAALRLPLPNMLLVVIEHACHYGMVRHIITDDMFQRVWKQLYLAETIT